MMVSVESADGLERRMRVQVPADRVESEVDSRLERVGRTAKIKGFRPGKVPMRVIRQRYGDQVRQEVLGEIMQATYFEALSQEKLRPAGGPRIEANNTSAGEDLDFTAVFEVYPELEVKGLDGLTITRPSVEIGESDLEDMIERLRRHENTALPGDIDYEAVDGLSNEVKQKLGERRPPTLAQPSRIPGVTAAAVSLLLIYLKKRGALERSGSAGTGDAGQRKLA